MGGLKIAYCTECGTAISQDTAYCRHCGASQTNTLTNTVPVLQPTQTGGFKKVIKWTGIGCGGLFSLFVVLIIVALIAFPVEDNAEGEKPAAKTVPDPTTRIDATTPATRTLTAIPTPTPMPTATPTPMPTATPTPMPIQVALPELFDEYDQNKVRANARLRYLENGNLPVSTSGYVDEVEELYVIVTPSQEQYSSQRLYCYYADTRAALHLTKGQPVSVTGRVSGTDGFSSRIHMFSCEFKGMQLEMKPTVSVQKLRDNVVQVFCTSGSILSPGSKGTGIIIDAEEGIVLTVHHVIADENECRTIEVQLQGTESRIPATSVKHCASIDRARLRISAQALSDLSLQPIYRAGAPAQPDQEIYFWGYGPGELRMGAGIVKDVRGKDIVTDAYSVPGDSGSPVFDENGHLLGTLSRGNRSDRTVFTGDEC